MSSLVMIYNFNAQIKINVRLDDNNTDSKEFVRLNMLYSTAVFNFSFKISLTSHWSRDSVTQSL